MYKRLVTSAHCKSFIFNYPHPHHALASSLRSVCAVCVCCVAIPHELFARKQTHRTCTHKNTDTTTPIPRFMSASMARRCHRCRILAGVDTEKPHRCRCELCARVFVCLCSVPRTRAQNTRHKVISKVLSEMSQPHAHTHTRTRTAAASTVSASCWRLLRRCPVFFTHARAHI